MRRTGLTVSLLLGLMFWLVLGWLLVRVAFGQVPDRRCRPFIIAGKQCGKLCLTPQKQWAIRGCKPLNKLMPA